MRVRVTNLIGVDTSREGGMCSKDYDGRGGGGMQKRKGEEFLLYCWGCQNE